MGWRSGSRGPMLDEPTGWGWPAPTMTQTRLPHIFPHSAGRGASELRGAGLPKPWCGKKFQDPGVVAEWLNAAVLKTAERETVS
jgi:hypothetical protein